MAESIGRSDGEESNCNGAQGDEKKNGNHEEQKPQRKNGTHLSFYHYSFMKWNNSSLDRVRTAPTTSEREKSINHGKNNVRWARIRRTLACHGTDSSVQISQFRI